MKTLLALCLLSATLYAQPNNQAVAPASGTSSSLTQLFTFSVQETGPASVTSIQFVINTTETFPNSCSGYMGVLSPTSVFFQLTNDNADGSTANVLPGTGTASNSQCSVNLANSSVTSTGNGATVNLAITFAASFSGTKNIYMATTDSANQYALWQQVGTWTIPGASTNITAALATTPGLDKAGNGVTISATFTDPVNAANISNTVVWIYNATTNKACAIQMDQTFHLFTLMNDAGNSWRPPFAPGGSDSNQECVINTQAPGFSVSGKSVTMTVTATILPAFAGALSISLSAASAAGPSFGLPPTLMGNWTVASGFPSWGSFSQSSASGSSGTFTATFTDPGGATNLLYMELTITAGGAIECDALVDYRNQEFQLIGDGPNLGWRAPIPPGGSDSNSQCTLNGAQSSFSYAGSVGTITVNFTFNPTFAGPKSISLWAENGNRNTIPVQPVVGAFTVTAGASSRRIRS
jgi:hypothetical protein